MNWGTAAQAIGAIITSVLGLVGIGGRQHRRRTNIKANLELLEQLDKSPWHEESFKDQARVWLESRIGLDVARLSGVEIKTKKDIPWGSVIFAGIVGGAAGWGGYYLSSGAFNWWSVPLWVLAGLMAIAIVGMVTNRDVRDDVPANDATS